MAEANQQKPRPMTAQQILNRVQKEADARLGDTVERLFLILRNRHTHKCWERKCDCEYCRFINGEYVHEKLILHRIKKRINRIDYWDAMDWEITLMPQLVTDQSKQKAKIKLLKGHKKELQENIL